MISFQWSADLDCIDADGLTNVATRVRWRCAAYLDGNDLAVSGVCDLAAPDPDNFIQAPEGITSDVIRAWVGAAAEEAEAALSERLAAAASCPAVRAVFVPPEGEA